MFVMASSSKACSFVIIVLSATFWNWPSAIALKAQTNWSSTTSRPVLMTEA
jgi:hypothetical protein